MLVDVGMRCTIVVTGRSNRRNSFAKRPRKRMKHFRNRKRSCAFTDDAYKRMFDVLHFTLCPVRRTIDYLSAAESVGLQFDNFCREPITWQIFV